MINHKNYNLSSFSIITFFILLSIVGISTIPLLNIQLYPSNSLPKITVSYSWSESSAKVLESEVTSKLEAVISMSNNIRNISSISSKGYGEIVITFKKNTDIDAARFELSNKIRRLYRSLPSGVSYPIISLNIAGENSSPILTYSISADIDPTYLKQYVQDNLTNELSIEKGVNNIVVSGGGVYEWIVSYDIDIIKSLNINPEEIKNSIITYFNENLIGIGELDSNKKNIRVSICGPKEEIINWSQIPVKKVSDRIITLGQIAKINYKKGKSSIYQRMNGLNMVNFSINSSPGSNSIKVANNVKNKIDSFKSFLPREFKLKLIYDSTDQIKEENNKTLTRTVTSLLVLLIFVFFLNRDFKYLLLIFISIISNILIAFFLYYLFHVELHIYSLAGITVSFGILVDNSIIMIDNIRQNGNKKVFISILAATLTTVGALSIIFFLNDEQSIKLIDFSIVIIINLVVSLCIAFYLIPALYEKLSINIKRNIYNINLAKKQLCFNKIYLKVISVLIKYRLVLIVLFVLGFGIPINLLPERINNDNAIAHSYNKLFGNELFISKIKPTLTKIIGGSFSLFSENIFETDVYAEPKHTLLSIRGEMPEGCTIKQLNDAVLHMESFIAQFEEVKYFQTTVRSAQNALIVIHFKEQFEFSDFPYSLKEELTRKAISIGGVNWYIDGIGRGFSNAINTNSYSEYIKIEGYNYDELYKWAQALQVYLSKNSRIKDISILGSNGWGAMPINEYYIKLFSDKLAVYNISPFDLFSSMKMYLYNTSVCNVYTNNKLESVKLRSNKNEDIDIWDLNNQILNIGDNKLKFSHIGEISKKRYGNNIYRNNQQYQLYVAYNFIGSSTYAKNERKTTISNFKDKLPLGYKIKGDRSRRWNIDDSKQYYLIFIVILIIYFISTILLESFKQSLAVIMMIPISFIGAFLTFCLFNFSFDQGGFASFILLSGITVNAGLYIITDFNKLTKKLSGKELNKIYIKAFNHKIVPIFLTIISTILGLIPFIWNGQNEVFWFSLAVGTIGGLLFSLVSIIFYLPIFLLHNKKQSNIK